MEKIKYVLICLGEMVNSKLAVEMISLGGFLIAL